MQKLRLILLIIGIAILTACSNKIYYTSELNTKVAEKGLSVNHIQFYLSKKIVMKRVLPHDTAEVNDGKIRFEDGKLIDEVIIKKNTPGTCEFIDNGFMMMSFEDGNNKLLKFIQGNNGKYYQLFINNDPKKLRVVKYDTAEYVILPGSDKARLWVRKDQNYISRFTKRVAEGRTVDNNY